MVTNEPHHIPASTIQDLLSRLGETEGDRELEVELFKTFYRKPVQLVRQSRAYFVEGMLPEDAADEDRHIWEMNHAPFKEWASERPDFLSDYYDADGSLVPEIAQFGYSNRDGEWVPHPELDPIPRFTSNVNDALLLKGSLFHTELRLKIEEVEGEWSLNYSVSLSTEEGEVIAVCKSGILSVAIIKVSLLALLSDRTPEFSLFQISEE